jgi:hypothetical protein
MKTASFLLVAMLALSLAAPLALGEEPARIPAKAIEAMNFFVGAWEADTFENGEKIGANVDRRRWAPGKHCLTIEWLGTEKGVEWRAAAISGWDAKADALVEHWYGSQGQSLMVRYPLGKMKQEVWEGTASFTTGDGKSSDGECQLTKTPAGYDYVARSSQDGKEVVFKVITRRVNAKEAAIDSARPRETGAELGNIPAKAIEAMSFFVGGWEGDDNTDGRKLGANHVQRRWAPGKHCFTIEWSGTHDGVASRSSGICGWDAKTDALVEHWYGSQGQSLMNCYPLGKMKENVWDGTFSFTTGDGKRTEGKGQFTTTPDEGVWVGWSTQDGKEVVFKSVAHRVKAKKASDSAKPRAQK